MSLFDQDIIAFGSRHVPASYLQQAVQASQHHKSQLSILLQQGKLPTEGWSDTLIEQLLTQLAQLDSNNFPHNVGVGEREARIYSDLVRRRHYGFGHGIGRSGDLCASQPKAAGSSLLYQLTCSLTLDVIRNAGIPSAASAVVVPCATGATLLLCLAALAPSKPNSRQVLWLRCDQKSCLKAIHTAGLEPVVVDGKLSGDEVVTDVAEVERLLSSEGSSRFRAVLSTTSCFAPRAADEVEKIAALCQQYDVPHIINNAYGVQSTKLMHSIREAARIGRVDCVIQSTDKNFMVPVGGAVVITFDKNFANNIGAVYPGRASVSPITDLFITLLSLGKGGYSQLTRQRNALKKHLDCKLQELADKHQLKLLKTPGNPISAGLALPSQTAGKSSTALGSMLFTRGVSGARVVTPGKNATVATTNITGWGSHHNEYPVPYLTAAASIGMTEHDVDTFCVRLDKCLFDWKKKRLSTDGSSAVVATDFPATQSCVDTHSTADVSSMAQSCDCSSSAVSSTTQSCGGSSSVAPVSSMAPSCDDQSVKNLMKTNSLKLNSHSNRSNGVDMDSSGNFLNILSEEGVKSCSYIYNNGGGFDN